MFECNDRVKSEEGEVYKVVAPTDGESATTVVWADENCNRVLIFPSGQLTLTDEPIVAGQHAHVTYAVTPKTEGVFSVSRRVDAVGIDGLISVYADLRKYLPEVSDIPIAELDKLVDEVGEQHEG